MFDGTKCTCDKDAPLWTPWTHKQLGWRFYNCIIPKEYGGRGFYQFKDPETNERLKMLIRGLRDRQKELHDTNQNLRMDIQ